MFKRQFANGYSFEAHAEMRVIKRALAIRDDLSSCELYVMRFRQDGTIACSKPCEHCLALIQKVGIKRIHYTTENGMWNKIKI